MPLRAWLLLFAVGFLQSAADGAPELLATGPSPHLAVDGERFATNSAWRGTPGLTNWNWRIDFGAPRKIATILQITGDHDFVLRNAPRAYQWKVSIDGANWTTAVTVANERRIFREHQIQPREFRFAQLDVLAAHGDFPTLREVEFLEPGARSDFPPWIIVVNATHDPALPGHGQEFIPLARTSSDSKLPAQQIWLDSFDESFLQIQPPPLSAFISGSFKDWCEVRREDFRGMAEVLKSARLPMWASCGGAQAIAIIAEHGIDQPWDCPHCRDPKNPRTPIYSHIGHTAKKPCGDYSGCEFERGPHRARAVKADPAFAGLEPEFSVIQSHCGQIEYMPKGWSWLVGPGSGSRTLRQAFKLNDAPIYPAQFHIEMAGAPETSGIIMSNFLQIARAWGGYRQSR